MFYVMKELGGKNSVDMFIGKEDLKLGDMLYATK